MSKGKARVLTGAMAAICAFAAVGSAETPQERLAAAFSYYLAEEGLWRQENAGRAAGDSSPVAWIKRYEWGPGRAMIFDNTYALMEDGSCSQWTHNVFVWDHKKNAIRGHIFHSAGMYLTVEVLYSNERESSAELRGTLPNGTEVRMRDVTDRSDPRKAVVTASVWDGKEWSTRDSVSWVRIAGDKNPCALPARR